MAVVPPVRCRYQLIFLTGLWAVSFQLACELPSGRLTISSPTRSSHCSRMLGTCSSCRPVSIQPTAHYKTMGAT